MSFLDKFINGGTNIMYVESFKKVKMSSKGEVRFLESLYADYVLKACGAKEDFYSVLLLDIRVIYPVVSTTFSFEYSERNIEKLNKFLAEFFHTETYLDIRKTLHPDTPWKVIHYLPPT